MLKLKYIDDIPPLFRNKYFLTIFLFLIWLLLFDANNLIDRYRQVRDLHKLEKEKEYYIKKIEEDRRKLNELKTDNHNLEKFAREQYHMKKADEDLFIVLTPREERNSRK